MNNNDYFYITAFKNNLLECHGDMFQQYFYSVMKAIYENFRKIEPQGAYGDRKCDGYRFKEGIFYQVYGPKDINTTNKEVQKRAISKINKDFEGLLHQIQLGYWEPVKEFYYVFNSSRGHYPDLDEEIRKLQDKYPEILFGIKDRDNILRLFSELDEYNKSNICNCNAPDIDSVLVNFAIINEIIKYMVNHYEGCNYNDELNIPNFNEKIKFNKLNPYFTSRLVLGSYGVFELNNFLGSYPGNISKRLCSMYGELYSKSKKKFPDDQNLQFKYIIEHSYDKKNTSKSSIANYESNICIILAKYFETCDIFEEPCKNT